MALDAHKARFVTVGTLFFDPRDAKDTARQSRNQKEIAERPDF